VKNDKLTTIVKRSTEAELEKASYKIPKPIKPLQEVSVKASNIPDHTMFEHNKPPFHYSVS
jgi:hypothetical protein